MSETAEHPIKLYLLIWLLLFVLSALSYMVDIAHLEGFVRWGAILTLMFLKAGFIIAIFMHVQWERLSLKWLLFAPPVAIVVLIALMAIEGGYTEFTRFEFFTN